MSLNETEPRKMTQPTVHVTKINESTLLTSCSGKGDLLLSTGVKKKMAVESPVRPSRKLISPSGLGRLKASYSIRNKSPSRADQLSTLEKLLLASCIENHIKSLDWWAAKASIGIFLPPSTRDCRRNSCLTSWQP